MDSILPNYFAIMKSRQSGQDIADQITKWVSQKKYKVEKICSAEHIVLCISSNTGEVLYYNSFLPLVEVSIEQENDQTSINMLFGLKKDVEILMIIFAGGAIFLGLFFLGLLLNQTVTGQIIFIPIAILLLTLSFFFGCFKKASEKIMKELLNTLADIEKDSLDFKIKW